MSSELWTIRRLLEWTTDYLKGRGISSARLEAEVLLAHALGSSRIQLYTRFDDLPSDEERTRFRDLVKRRAAGEPVAYLVGHKEFYSLDFDVSPDVLIPRPETEQLALEGIEYLRRLGKAGRSDDGAENSPTPSGKESTGGEKGTVGPFAVLDIGTGSGALAITIAKNVPEANVLAVDLSPEALAVAEKNAEKLGVADRIEFRVSDLLATVEPDSTFDLIVSNPPYVSRAEYDALDRTERDYEPKMALLSGETGLELIERILEEAPRYLRKGGKLLIEMSPMIAPAAEKLLKASPFAGHFTILRDFAGLARTISAEKP